MRSFDYGDNGISIEIGWMRQDGDDGDKEVTDHRVIHRYLIYQYQTDRLRRNTEDAFLL
jgi:hypothetical protein